MMPEDPNILITAMRYQSTPENRRRLREQKERDQICAAIDSLHPELGGKKNGIVSVRPNT